MKERDPFAVKIFFINNILKILKSNYISAKYIFDYCIRNDFIDIAALLVEKFHFKRCFENLNPKVFARIFDERNLIGNENLINENSEFFLMHFSHLKVEHLKGYSNDQLFNTFESFAFISRNYHNTTFKVIIEAMFSRSLNFADLKRYLRSLYSSCLQNIINIMIKDFMEKNSKENDSSIRKNNLFNVVQAVISLPIPNCDKITLLNSFKLSSKEEELVLIKLLDNPLPFEEALDLIINALYLEYNLANSINKTLELLE